MMQHPLTRRRVVCAGLAGVAAIVGGCAHDQPQSRIVGKPAKHEEGAIAAPNLLTRFSYEERLRNVLVAPDKGKLVVLGERYHYLFDDAHLAAVIGASFRQDLEGSFGKFQVDPNNVITGTYRLVSRTPLTGAQAAEATRLGFTSTADGRYELAATITGQRATVAPLADPSSLPKFDKPYTVTVEALGTARPASTSPGSSPLTGLANIVLLPVFFLFIAGCNACR